MRFSEPIVKEIELYIDRNPNTNIKRAEEFLKAGLWYNALREVSIALYQCDTLTEILYKYELVKVMYALQKYEWCKIIINKENDSFKSKLNEEKYERITQIYAKCEGKKNFNSLIIDNDTVTIYYLGTENINSVRIIWDITSSEKTKDLEKGKNNIWSITVSGLKEGVYFYKFLVNDTETIDIYNHKIILDNDELKNIFFILNDEQKFENKKSIELDDGTLIDIYGQIDENLIGNYYYVLNTDDKAKYIRKGEMDGLLLNGKGWYRERYFDGSEHISYGIFRNDYLIDGISADNFPDSQGSGIKYGEFTNGKFEGKGQLALFTYEDFMIQEFNFKNGVPNGRGKSLENYGTFLYEGELVNGKYDGNGYLSINEGETIYEGKFQCGWMIEGRLVRETLKGDKYIYEGQLKKHLYHGRGKLTFNGISYVGDFYNNKEHGKGRFIFENGDTSPTYEFNNGELVTKETKKNRGCYLTTAMCEILGKDIDCIELNELRWFRDNILYKNSTGIELVEQYYKIAPLISVKLNNNENKLEIALEMKRRYIDEIVLLIRMKDYEKVIIKYQEMVMYVKNNV